MEAGTSGLDLRRGAAAMGDESAVAQMRKDCLVRIDYILRHRKRQKL
jgi:hypothetical protein